MGYFKEKAEEWNTRYKEAFDNSLQKYNDDLLREILSDMNSFNELNDILPLEKIILLVNECIIMDAVNDSQIEYENRIFSRSDILEQVKVLYEEFYADDLIVSFYTKPIRAFKERLSYLIALLLCKVHDYRGASRYFHESRERSKVLSNWSDPNGLNLQCRIQRDIHYAYCCKYIGTPDRNIGEISKALQILLGIKQDISAVEYWIEFKKECFNNLKKMEDILISTSEKLDKSKQIIEILVDFFPDEHCVFKRLQNDMENNWENEYIAALKVLAHCLNEINLIGNVFIGESGDVREQTQLEAMFELQQKNLIKMLSKFFIDALGDKYITHQATIRAEQGNNVDAIKKMHSISTQDFTDQGKAELDFYQYYFESLFFIKHSHDKHSHGEDFVKYCNAHKNGDVSVCEDAMLHYQVVWLRNKLREYIKSIYDSDERNQSFLCATNRISSSDCSGSYEELREKNFSVYVNSQIVIERERLILIYRVLKMLQDLELPLFFDDGADFSRQLNVTNDIEVIFELCRKINAYTQSSMSAICSTHSCRFCEAREENGCNWLRQSQNSSADSDEFKTIKIDGLVFDIYGNYKSLKSFLDNSYLMKYNFLTKQESLKYHLDSRYKMLIFDDKDEWYNCCATLSREINAGAKYHIFYIGKPDFENFDSSPIVALPQLDICFLMTYIYMTLEQIITEVLNPKPICNIVPLRNISNYEFQTDEFMTLLKYPDGISKELKFEQGGIGIYLKDNPVEVNSFSVRFRDDHIERSCITIVKFEEDKLYVLRDGKLVRKMVHSGLVRNMYQEYFVAKKKSQNRRHQKEFCSFQKPDKCRYFFGEINDEPGEGTLTVKDQGAGTKLLRFLRIACEEDDIWEPNMYVLEEGNWISNRKNFELFIFKEDLSTYISKECCCSELVQIEKNIPASGEDKDDFSTTATRNYDSSEEVIRLKNEINNLQQEIISEQRKMSGDHHTDYAKQTVAEMKQGVDNMLIKLESREKNLEDIWQEYNKVEDEFNEFFKGQKNYK